MPDQQNIEFISKVLTFWKDLSAEDQELLERNTHSVHYQQGENIHCGGNDCIGVLLIKSGELRTYILSEDGREITLYRQSPGNVCILSASCILKNITFDVMIDAVKDTEVLC